MNTSNRPDDSNDYDSVDWLIVSLQDLFEHEKNKEYWKGFATGLASAVLVGSLFFQPQPWVKKLSQRFYNTDQPHQTEHIQAQTAASPTPIEKPKSLVKHNAVSNAVHKVIAQVNTK